VHTQAGRERVETSLYVFDRFASRYILSTRNGVLHHELSGDSAWGLLCSISQEQGSISFAQLFMTRLGDRMDGFVCNHAEVTRSLVISNQVSPNSHIFEDMIRHLIFFLNESSPFSDVQPFRQSRERPSGWRQDLQVLLDPQAE